MEANGADTDKSARAVKATSQSVTQLRKKTPGACERCRDKRIKCNGTQPCSTCLSKNVQCVFSFGAGVGNDIVTNSKLDLILSRLESIEQKLVPHHLELDLSSLLEVQPSSLPDRESEGVTEWNSDTGCFEFYGATSTFMIVSSLAERAALLEQQLDRDHTSKRQRTRSGHPARMTPAKASLDLSDLTKFCDYVIPASSYRQPYRLKGDVTDRHLVSLFNTIHVLLPVFDEQKFRSRYEEIKPLFGDARIGLQTPECPTRPQFLCLLYAVLALGALYEDERDDTSSWASWYFGEAQDLLSRYLDAANIDLVQAAMLLGAYAQHAMKPGLAYILTGLATRLGFSIGINIETIDRPKHFDVQEARRTWWLIYIQEVELSLDSGRPMSLQTSMMQMPYPSSDEENQVTLIRYLAKIADITRRVLDIGNTPERRSTQETSKLLADLHAWRASLPPHLQFASFEVDRPSSDPYSWTERQQSSLRIHYNLTIIVLTHPPLMRAGRDSSPTENPLSSSANQSICLSASRDMIQHIYQLLKTAPRLRRWSYYCFYCLQATLVLMAKLTESLAYKDTENPHKSSSSISPSSKKSVPDHQVDLEYFKLCQLSVEVLEQIEVRASKRCAEMVQGFLHKWRRDIQQDEDMPRKSSHTASSLPRSTTNRSGLSLPEWTDNELLHIPGIEPDITALQQLGPASDQSTMPLPFEPLIDKSIPLESAVLGTGGSAGSNTFGRQTICDAGDVDFDLSPVSQFIHIQNQLDSALCSDGQNYHHPLRGLAGAFGAGSIWREDTQW